MQDHAADELDVEVALPERALGGLAAGGEGRHQDVVERAPSAICFLNIIGARTQRLVGELHQLILQRVDLLHPRL